MKKNKRKIDWVKEGGGRGGGGGFGDIFDMFGMGGQGGSREKKQ